MDNKRNPWEVVKASVIGAAHVRRKMPNQDRISTSQDAPTKAKDKASRPTVLAVADGHGSAKYVRSGQGAEFAVLAACRVAADELSISSDFSNSTVDEIVSHFKTKVFNTWLTDINDFTTKHPFTPEELESLNEKVREDLMQNPRKAYGCTLLLVICYDDMVITLQLGDGNILLLYDDGRVEYTDELAGEPGEETDSLCTVQSPHEIKHHIFKGSELPVLATVSSDGLYKSFEYDAEFLKIPQTCYDALRANDFQAQPVEDIIEAFLRTVTDNGAGDDTTLGIIFRK